MKKSEKTVLLPLLQVLQTIKPEHRMILLAHFDDKTSDSLYATITQVLKSNKVPIAKRLLLKSKLTPYKKDFRYLNDKKKSGTQKKKRLTQLGGGPMTHVLKTAIPLLLNMFTK
jgi:hypothetical protein